ncbi:uncharacterized protein LOC131005763 isoform X2 [Salvia miltiorrhiza]|uniref:uncharacterized protein LOC131005763 isoform X2 n=1 Tax=Salvia miltiorrhiza TaxID=226208 RepID=UPI0025ABC394|nr:uncharacterized protein LOC131005763 isoform X2 [Salvia miltiorrhiza]
MRGRRMEKQEISDDDDWRIEEYEGEKQEDWNWMMDAAKKVVMAGIVISSAPLLLPPFLVVSALGFALSLPSGVVLASYACTRKLMTKLLPPPQPLLLPYHDEEEEEEEEEEICYPPNYNGDDVEVGRERELEEEREMSSSSSSSEDENVIDVKEIQISSDLVLKNDDDDGKNAAGGEDEPKEGDQLKEEKVVLSVSLVAEDEPKEGDQLKEELKEEKEGSHGVNGGLHSHEELISEEKIWEKIDAIRVIVGFKAPRRSTYLEELKALYLFTGIDPPTSQDQSHLTFLMSVIGLK